MHQSHTKQKVGNDCQYRYKVRHKQLLTLSVQLTCYDEVCLLAYYHCIWSTVSIIYSIREFIIWKETWHHETLI